MLHQASISTHDAARQRCPARTLSCLIGHTPLLSIDATYKGRAHRIYAKAEQYNLTGSIKDRVALSILSAAMHSGELSAGDTIVEATSGNSGIAFAAVGRALGCNVRIFMPDWVSTERMKLLRSLGAELQLVSREEGGLQGAMDQADAFIAPHENVFSSDQFSNEQNCLAHEQTTGAEIVQQLQNMGVKPDAFVSGVGTGGTAMGVGRALRAFNPSLKVHAVEPEQCPTLSTGHKAGSHRIQGISTGFIPDIVRLEELDNIITIDDGDAIIMAQRLASELGLGVGISSGANFIAALKLADALPDGAAIVTILCDDNKKYLSTDLAGCEPVRPMYVSTDTELHGFSSMRFG